MQIIDVYKILLKRKFIFSVILVGFLFIGLAKLMVPVTWGQSYDLVFLYRYEGSRIFFHQLRKKINFVFAQDQWKKDFPDANLRLLSSSDDKIEFRFSITDFTKDGAYYSEIIDKKLNDTFSDLKFENRAYSKSQFEIFSKAKKQIDAFNGKKLTLEEIFTKAKLESSLTKFQYNLNQIDNYNWKKDSSANFNTTYETPLKSFWIIFSVVASAFITLVIDSFLQYKNLRDKNESID